MKISRHPARHPTSTQPDIAPDASMFHQVRLSVRVRGLEPPRPCGHMALNHPQLLLARPEQSSSVLIYQRWLDREGLRGNRGNSPGECIRLHPRYILLQRRSIPADDDASVAAGDGARLSRWQTHLHDVSRAMCSRRPFASASGSRARKDERIAMAARKRGSASSPRPRAINDRPAPS
jgi:hypothetical protein